MSEAEIVRLSPPGELSTERREQLKHDAARVLDATVPPNTRRAFEQDWRVWLEFCQVANVPMLEASPDLLVAFVTWLAQGNDTRKPAAPSTITRRLSGVLDGWKRHNVPIPHGVTRDARKVITAYERHIEAENLTVGRGQAHPLTIRQLRRIAAACPDTLRGKRDRAVILLGFGLGARRSELAALCVNDITVHEQGLLVRLRATKTGHRDVAVLRGTNAATCPVVSWQSWIHAAGLAHPDERGRAFRRISRSGTIGGGLSDKSINNLIIAAGERADIDVRLTGHSVRAGMATEARRAGHDMLTIANQGGWKPNSQELFRYTRIVDQWSDNALSGIGL